MNDESLKLFDDFKRDYFGPAKYTESRWKYMNRSARPGFQYVRDVLDEWFADYEADSSKRHNLCNGFRSLDDEKHLSSFFELYLYQLFKKQGLQIEVEPSWAGRHPDFLLTARTGEQVLLEATGTYPRRWFGRIERLELGLIDYLNDYLDSPHFFLQIEILATSDRNFRSRRIRNELQDQLNQIDYDELVRKLTLKADSMDDFPSIEVECDEWAFRFTVIPKNEEGRRKTDLLPVAARWYGFENVDAASSIKSRIDDKYAHYGELEIPYLLAINISDSFANEDTIIDALLGQEAVLIDFETRQARHCRQPDGAWTSPEGYQKQRMSAVCIFRNLRPEDMFPAKPMIWHHPAANNPLSPNLLQLSQQVPNHEEGVYKLMEGILPCELFQLDETKMP